MSQGPAGFFFNACIRFWESHDNARSQDHTWISVINYGILWEWLQDSNDLMTRYNGIVLDEFAGLKPRRHFLVLNLLKFLQDKQKKHKQHFSKHVKVVMTAASLTREYVAEFVTEDFGFVSVTARRFPMERCIVAPMEANGLLDVIVHLLVQLIMRYPPRRGDAIVFLPGKS